MKQKQYMATYSTEHFCDGCEFDDLDEAKASAIDWLIECMNGMYNAIGMPEAWTESQKEEWNYMIETTHAYVEKRAYGDPDVLWEDCWFPTDEELEDIGWKMYD